MNRKATFVAITLVSLVATPLVVRAANPAATPAAPTKVASIEVSGERTPAPVAVAADQGAAAPCAKRVRVVYQGYGPAPDGCAAR